jgi:hypothetical protein
MLTEGKNKTNVKPQYLKCVCCGFSAPEYKFENGFWFFKKRKCPICGSHFYDKIERKKTTPAPQGSKLRTDDKRCLEFIYNRLINVYNENSNYDYMINFKKIIDK